MTKPGLILICISTLALCGCTSHPQSVTTTGPATSPAASASSLGASISPSASPTAQTPSQADGLILPYATDKFAINTKFGIYPFGLRSSEHPEGHAGINFEVKATTQIIAPADMEILTIISPAGRPDEHNVIAKINEHYRLEFLRVGALANGVKIGSQLKQGDAFASPGRNTVLQTTMFHMGILNSNDAAVCPDESFWSTAAWQELDTLRRSSKDDQGKPYSSICFSTQPIARASRGAE